MQSFGKFKLERHILGGLTRSVKVRYAEVLTASYYPNDQPKSLTHFILVS